MGHEMLDGTARPSVITVRQSGSYGGYPTFAVAQYAAIPRKKDGVPTWRLIHNLEDCHRGKVRADHKMIEWATKRGLPYCRNIRENQEVLHNWK